MGKTVRVDSWFPQKDLKSSWVGAAVGSAGLNGLERAEMVPQARNKEGENKYFFFYI